MTNTAARLSFLIWAATSACAKPDRSLVPVDVTAAAEVASGIARVKLTAVTGGRAAGTGEYAWAPGVDGLLKVGIYLDGGVSGEIDIQGIGVDGGGLTIASGSGAMKVMVSSGRTTAVVKLLLVKGAPPADGGADGPAEGGLVDGADGGGGAGGDAGTVGEAGSDASPDGPIVRNWSPLVHAETDDSFDASDADVAVDGKGTTIVVMEIGPAIYAARHTVATGWEKEKPIETRGTCLLPKIGMDRAGMALALWSQDDSTMLGVWSSRFDGVAWGTPFRVAPDRVSSLEFVMNPDGTAAAVWMADVSLDKELRGAMFSTMTGWSAAQSLEPWGGYPDEARVAIDAAGNAMVVWGQDDGTGDYIWYTRGVPGMAFSAPAKVWPTVLVHSDNYPDVATNAAGRATVAWFQRSSSYDELWANQYLPGTGFVGATMVTMAPSTDTQPPRVAVDAAGNVTALWPQWKNGVYNMRQSRFVIGAGWQVPTYLENAMAGTTKPSTDPPELGMDAAGNVHAVWWKGEYTPTRTAEAWTARFDLATGAWSAPSVFAPLPADPTGKDWAPFYPQIAVAADGTAAAVLTFGYYPDLDTYATLYR